MCGLSCILLMSANPSSSGMLVFLMHSPVGDCYYPEYATLHALRLTSATAYFTSHVHVLFSFVGCLRSHGQQASMLVRVMALPSRCCASCRTSVFDLNCWSAGTVFETSCPKSLCDVPATQLGVQFSARVLVNLGLADTNSHAR